MRLIDADEFEKRLRVAARDRNSEAPWAEYGWVQRIVYFMPSADSVKHGHWIDISSPDRIIKGATYKCSECGEMEFYPSKFCPDCGTRMDADI